MKKIAATIMSIVMMLAILVPSALAQTEKQFYDQWYEDTSWKLAKCYYNWNPTGCLGCAGINEEFISAYEYYKSVYPNSSYLAKYTDLYNRVVATKAIYDTLDPDIQHIEGVGYLGPCNGHFGSAKYHSGDVYYYDFYLDDGRIESDIQASTRTVGRLDNLQYENIGFMYWAIYQQNKDGVWEQTGGATVPVTNMNIVKYANTFGFATFNYNKENPGEILDTFEVEIITES